jgi:hypothetical protein
MLFRLHGTPKLDRLLPVAQGYTKSRFSLQAKRPQQQSNVKLREVGLVSIPFKNVMGGLLALVEITLAIRFNLDALKDKMNGRSLLLNQVARSNRKHGRFSAERDMEPVQTYSAYPLFGGNCCS